MSAEPARTTTQQYQPVATSARRARQLLREATIGLQVDQEAVVLLGGELVTNAIRHAQTQFTVGISVGTDRVRVNVTDASARLPVLRAADPDTADGFGMNLVASVASAWGTDPFDGGKTVWFELPIEGGRHLRLPDGSGSRPGPRRPRRWSA